MEIRQGTKKCFFGEEEEEEEEERIEQLVN